jgi:hypothetical protein
MINACADLLTEQLRQYSHDEKQTQHGETSDYWDCHLIEHIGLRFLNLSGPFAGLCVRRNSLFGGATS